MQKFDHIRINPTIQRPFAVFVQNIFITRLVNRDYGDIFVDFFIIRNQILSDVESLVFNINEEISDMRLPQNG